MGSRTDRVRAGGTLQHSFPVARGPIGPHSRQGGTRNPQPTLTVRVGLITTRGRRPSATLPRRDMSHVLPSATVFAWANDCTVQRGDCSGSRLPTSIAPQVAQGQDIQSLLSGVTYRRYVASRIRGNYLTRMSNSIRFIVSVSWTVQASHRTTCRPKP